MLSYMLPVDEKPPKAPALNGPSAGPASVMTTTTGTNGHHLQLNLTNGRPPIVPHANAAAAASAALLSKESSVSSFASDATTSMTLSGSTPPPLKPGTKAIVANGAGGGVVLGSGKHQSLKRVSFGSSKGSMVETLIFESPLQEEHEQPSPIAENGTSFPSHCDQTEDEREKVRVSFVLQSQPREVVLPDEPVILTDSEFMMAAAAIAESNHVITTYTRQESTESGWDNPFRPGGDLSREADEIVELIKGGKPITPTSGEHGLLLPGGNDPNSCTTVVDGRPQCGSASPPQSVESPLNKAAAGHLTASSPQKNGSAPAAAATKNGVPTTASVDPKSGTNATVTTTTVQRATVKPASNNAGAVEHVVIKKTRKCECCVVQ